MYISSDDLHEYFLTEAKKAYDLAMNIGAAITRNDIMPPKELVRNKDAEEVLRIITNIIRPALGHASSEMEFKTIRFNVDDKCYKNFKQNIDINKLIKMLGNVDIENLHKKARKYYDEYVVNKENHILSELEQYFVDMLELTEKLEKIINQS